jgi:hypothetical protein
MAKITGILCQIITGRIDGAGTDGSVYLGLGGREFRLDSSADDYERGSWREYILGRGPVEPNLPPPQIRVQNKEKNDPRTLFPLDTTNLNLSPVYIRFEPEGSSPDWNLRSVFILVYTGNGQFFRAYHPPEEFDNLWMSKFSGKILYLTKEWNHNEQTILDKGRKLAAEVGQ